MFLRTQAQRLRPFSVFESELFAHWNAAANAVMNGIIITAFPQRGGYDVKSTIDDQFGEKLAEGEYDSSRGIHAEISALETCPPSIGAVLSVNLPPCKRCAAILAYYCENFNFTIRAPNQNFATTYTGAYHLPNFIGEVIIDNLVRQRIVSQPESVSYRSTILSKFQSHPW